MECSNEEKKSIGKIIKIVSFLIILYLGLSHINKVALFFKQIISLIQPILIGLIMSLFLNVPNSAIEKFLTTRMGITRGSRPLSIFLSIILVVGILLGVSVLVIPELINAITMLFQIASDSIKQLSALGMDSSKVEAWFLTQREEIINYIIKIVSSFTSNLVTFFISLIFAIYILVGKEKLKMQTCRLIKAWLPQNISSLSIHVCTVCNKSLRCFIAGQTVEAVILGTLCVIGMTLLQIPYAPTIGALVGVTALIPIVGAFIGTIVGAILILTINPVKAIAFVIFLLILQQIEGNIIYPKVVGSKINLPAIWVLAAITVGGNLFGPLGMLLGVPATSAAYTLLKEATLYRESKKTTAN